jgi:hypothetical protein
LVILAFWKEMKNQVCIPKTYLHGTALSSLPIARAFGDSEH